MAEPGFPPRSLNCKATELNQNAPWHGAQSGWDQDPVACFPHQEPRNRGAQGAIWLSLLLGLQYVPSKSRVMQNE